MEAEQICLSGDVLFAGSIGRTDLPGGSTETMLTSLRDKILPLADDTVVLPGHGPATTIGRERAQNPYLRELIAASAELVGEGLFAQRERRRHQWHHVRSAHTR